MDFCFNYILLAEKKVLMHLMFSGNIPVGKTGDHTIVGKRKYSILNDNLGLEKTQTNINTNTNE